MQTSPRIGIIGTGAIGGFYGLMLARAGFDVHFLLRSEYDAVAEHGLFVHSPVHGELHLHPVQAYRDVAEMPACDWLLVGAKSTSNPTLAPIVSAAAAEGAKVVLLQNGLNNEASMRKLLPDHVHLMGGLCYVSLFRTEPGHITHGANGLIDFGYHSGPATDEEGVQAIIGELAEMLKTAGIPTRILPNVDAARWQKLIWNGPFNGASVVLDAGTDAMLTDPGSRQLITDFMAEITTAAAACGHPIPDGFADNLLAATAKMPDYYPSMYQDWKHKRPMELDSLYAEPIALAKAAGAEMPKTEVLLNMLRFIQARRLADA
ncbi:putative 2-dehydropantoate 2-reductase [Halopseudomonas salegens]|uniref:2-dehydropantoate 2-reductase n=1 Tax=Halopseudomonas salegens TaxID=1434072 RepID=A0A1H2EW78_9GAMM|nr:putative 2-dehydropantoate 2-reductase [Halopseudomonas salegens]SDT99396.1 ketopantoate reductase [Halopseudomonas salegens]